MAVEDVVAEDEAAGVTGQEVLADEEGLGEAVRAGLYGIGEVDAPLPSPSSCSKRGVSSGVEMMSTSRIPASMRTESG
jgi:hypothetical protein